MYAVIRTGGKQYRVAADDVIEIEKIVAEPGDIVSLEEVLMLGGDGGPTVGTPLIAGASVAAEVLEQKRAAKLLVFKKKRRKNYRRKHGHRQHLTALRITEILTDGKAPSKAKAAKKPEAKPAEDDKAPEAKPDSQPAARAFAALKEPEGTADDLKKISGVGPKLEEKLNELGIYHYWQVAGFSAEDVSRVDDELNFKGRIERDDWIGQANKLMEDDS